MTEPRQEVVELLASLLPADAGCSDAEHRRHQGGAWVSAEEAALIASATPDEIAAAERLLDLALIEQMARADLDVVIGQAFRRHHVHGCQNPGTAWTHMSEYERAVVLAALGAPPDEGEHR